MNEYKISDYTIFDNAVATTTELSNSVESVKRGFEDCKSTLNNESIFMGPIADECFQALYTVNSKMEETKASLAKTSEYLSQTSARYQEGDAEAAAQVAAASAQSPAITSSAYANPGGLTGSNLDFVNSIKDGAIEGYNKYGVLPSVTMAQAILESGWGQYASENNIFGIKAGDNWTGGVQYLSTNEQAADGSIYTITDAFRSYDSPAQSMEDHAQVLSQDLYQPVINSTNYVDACNALQQCGYATAQNYSDTLVQIIQENGLDQWDPKS